MGERFSDDALRRKLRALPVPAVPDALRARVLSAVRSSRPGALLHWLAGLALSGLLVAVVVVAALEYRTWQETEELVRLDELSVASMLVL